MSFSSFSREKHIRYYENIILEDIKMGFEFILIVLAIFVGLFVVDFIGDKFFGLYNEIDEEEDDGVSVRSREI